MAHKVSNGFIAPKPEECEFTVVEKKRNNEIEHDPSGVFIHGERRVGVYMNYAGLESSAWSTFELPTDPEFLREIAEAINLMADHIETDGGRRRKGFR